MSQEIELKLSLPQRALPALRRHPLFANAERVGKAQTLDNVYFDTPGLALKARKVALRTRKEGRRWLQTVKCAALSTGGLTQRPEWEQPYGGNFDFGAIDNPDVVRLLEYHRDALVPVLSTRFRRDTRACAPREGVRILLMLDTGTIEAGGRSAPICELELELVAGDPLDLLELARDLARDLPLMPADLSKAERGYRLFHDQAPAAVRAEPSRLEARQGVIAAFRDLAHGCLRQWQANAAAAAALAAHPAGDESGAAEAADTACAECIHQLRIALRRLRSLLRLFAPALPAEFTDAWNERLAELADRYGDARDIDVLYADFLAPLQDTAGADELGGEELPALLALADRRRKQARAAAIEHVADADQGLAMLEFSIALLRLPEGALLDAVALKAFARLRLARLRKKARRRYQAAGALIPAQLHKLRIALKRLRYGTEFFAPLFATGRTKRYLDALNRAQDTLGFLHDMEAARARLQQWAGEDAALQRAAAFALGWQGARYTRRRRRALGEVETLLWGKTPW